MPDFVDKVFNYTYNVTNFIGNKAGEIVGNAMPSSETVNKISDAVTGISLPSIPAILSTNMQLAPLPPPPSVQHSNGIFTIGIKKIIKYLKSPYVWLGLALGISYLNSSKKIKRAMRLPDGKRFEVVLIIGSPTSVFIQKMIHDLNKRGYVVYVTIDNEKEMQVIESIDDVDVKHLWIDWKNEGTIKTSLLKFAKILDSPIEESYELSWYSLRSVIFVPNHNVVPKMRYITEFGTDLSRCIDLQFGKINNLLNCGLSSIMKEGNKRLIEVSDANGTSNIDKSVFQTLSGFGSLIGSIFGLWGAPNHGGVKFIWLNFFMINSHPRSKTAFSLLNGMNSVYYNQLRLEMAPSALECVRRFMGEIREPEKIDMSMVNVNILKKTGLNESSFNIFEYISLFFKEFTYYGSRSFANIFNGLHWLGQLIPSFKSPTPKNVHYLIFDLINSNQIFSNYRI